VACPRVLPIKPFVIGTAICDEMNSLPDSRIPSKTHNIESIGYEANTGLQPCKPKSSHCPQDDTGERNDKETATCGHKTKLSEASRQI